MRTISIPAEMEQKIVAFCNDEIKYHVYESDCASEYIDETEAEIFLLSQLGHEDVAEMYRGDFIMAIENSEEYIEPSIYAGMNDHETLIAFIDDNLVDFIGYDCFEDESGGDYNSASYAAEEYVNKINKKDLKALATAIRNDYTLLYCENGAIKFI